MSDENAFEQAITDLGYSLRTVIPMRISRLSRQPQSPIERQFLIGFMALSYTTPCYDFGDGFGKFYDGGSDLPRMTIELQAPVEGYRADFLVTVILAGTILGKVVVECDGHNFHERTKDQAARDRSRDRDMTIAGYKVLRFTGSEIYRDVMKCVAETHQMAWSLFLGAKGGK